MWAAFNAKGLTYWLTNAAQDFGIGRDANAWTVLVDHQQQVWAGTRSEGLFRFQTNHFQPVPGTEDLGRQIFALFEDRERTNVGGCPKGLARWNGTGLETVTTTRDRLQVTCSASGDAEGNLWVGTESSGLYYFRGRKIVLLSENGGGLPGNGVSCLYLDREGVLWVGTSGHGLARFDQGQWRRYSTDDGLASNSIDYLIEDDAGILWIGSNAGLMRIHKNALNDFVSGKGNLLPCRTYVETDGLPTRECSAGAQPAAGRTRDGRLWFPTTEGLVSVNPADIITNRQPPQVMIESVLVDGQEQKTNRFSSTWPPAVTIPPGSEQLEIHLHRPEFLRARRRPVQISSGRPRNRLDGRRCSRGQLPQYSPRAISFSRRRRQRRRRLERNRRRR